MRRRNRSNNNNMKKERAIMIASSVFVLAALTMTGVYVKQHSKQNKEDGYSIDFSALEHSSKQNEKASQPDNGFANLTGLEDDLDYSPPLEEAGSGKVRQPGALQKPTEDEGARKPSTGGNADENYNSVAAENMADEAAMAADAGEMGEEAQLPEEVPVETPALSFSTGDRLVWPINGNVLINFSMDKTVYFATLEQYKRNPAIVIAATEGDVITAAAAGSVTEVFYNEEIGNAVRVDIGSGYEAIYGQLKDIQVSVGSYINAGDIIGYVAVPTKYYSVEGCNVYFGLTKDKQPVNPLGQLQ